MTQITDAMFKSLIVGGLFITFMGMFNILFIGGELGDTGDMSLTQIVNLSWRIFTQPEILFLNAVLGIVGIIISLIVIRELLPA